MRGHLAAFFLGTACFRWGLAQEPVCQVANPSPYFVTVNPADRPVTFSVVAGVIPSADCQAVLNDRALPSAVQPGFGLVATLQPSEFPPEGYGFLSIRSKTSGTSSSQSQLIVAPAGRFLSFVRLANSDTLYAVQPDTVDTGRLVRLDPTTKTVTAQSGALSQPRLSTLDGGGNTIWVSTEAGRSVTGVSLPGLQISPSLAMPPGKVVQRLWGIPWMAGCFVAEINSTDTLFLTPGDLTLYCGGRALNSVLSASEKIRDLLFEQSGDAWAYSEKSGRLFRVRADATGLTLDGSGVAMPPGGSRLVAGFGRVYFGNQIYRKADLSVRTGPEIDSVLGVDEELGLVYAGRNYSGVFLVASNLMLLHVTRDPDLQDVLGVFNKAAFLPGVPVPAADPDSFTPLSGGRYAYRGLSSVVPTQPTTVYVFRLGGIDKKLDLRPEGVLHGASLKNGPVAPGLILSLFGPGIGPSQPTAVPPLVSYSVTPGGWNDWGVTFNGIEAVGLFGSAGQLNVVVPDAVRQSQFTDIRVHNGAFVSPPVRLRVAAAQPAFFTADALGGAAIAVFPDGQIAGAGRNAKAGETVSLFGTGFGGPGDFGLQDGGIVQGLHELDHSRLQIVICGKPAVVSFAGLAPGFLFGLFQFNVQIPSCDQPANGHAPIVAVIDGISSPDGVALPVEF